MEEKILFSNETKITDENFKILMFYSKLCYSLQSIIIKLAICVFIIVGSLVLDFSIIYKIFFVFMAVLGIKETFRIKEKRAKDITALRYNFFENCFQVDNYKVKIEIQYTEIEKIIDTKKYYYFIIDKHPMILDKNGFILENKDDIKKFISCKSKI